MMELMKSWEGFGRTGSWLNRDTTPEFLWMDWEKPRKQEAQPGLPVPWQEFEPSNFRTQVQNVTSAPICSVRCQCLLLFIYLLRLFNDAVTISDCVAPNVGWLWPKLMHYPDIALEGLTKTTKTFSRDSRSLGPYLNPDLQNTPRRTAHSWRSFSPW
jgi:hypothetical protein